MSCWNVSSAQSARKTYCLTETQWSQFLAAANVQCKDGPVVRGLCPEFWKQKERVQRGQHASASRDHGNLAGDNYVPQYVFPYLPTMPDGFVWSPPAAAQ